MSPREKITLPKIDWLVEALEPYISREINDLHIKKVRTYFTNNNGFYDHSN